jgi:hypothetical protein
MRDLGTRVRRLEESTGTSRDSFYLLIFEGDSREDAIAAHLASHPEDEGKTAHVTRIVFVNPACQRPEA